MMHRVATGRMIAVWMVWGVVGLAAISPAPAMAQVSPEESAKKIKPAPGLEATLWASEPLLSNPTNIDVDSRGRVWVAEGLNYRLTRGGNRRFKRIEEADRIKILEDTDGDGKADKVTVFADKVFPVPMGIAVEEHYNKDGKYTGCRVFVGNSPDLLVLEDTDGDDKADKRYPLLTGFGGIDSDHGVHGMVLGIDGKLYFTHGDGCCSVQQDHSERAQNFNVIDKSGRHVSSDQLANTLRVNRDGTEFEIICDRQRNNYETCMNSFGNVFTSDNDDDGNRGCRVIWAMDGGHYGYRTPGSPRHWGEDVPGNVPKIVGTGNGSPCSIMVYEGELLPAQYRGGIFEVDAGTRQVNFFPITRKGAAFRTDYKVFLGSDDPWFRPVDACSAPDGSVFVADWYDAGVGGHAFSDQTTGRIYRVAPKGGKVTKPKPDFATVPGLIAALKSPNIATMDAARRLLIESADPLQRQVPLDVWARQTRERLHGLFLMANPDNPRVTERARAYWTIYAIESGYDHAPFLVDQIDPDPRIRELVVRLLGRDCRENGHVEYQKPKARKPPAALKHLEALLAMADDPDAGVRRELILAFRNLSTDKVGDALRKLTASWDGQDRWYLEALGLALEKRESDFLSSLFDGTLYGGLDLEHSGRNDKVALPPYFPVDRNEAFIAVGTPDLPATALSKYLGLAWRLHRREVLPMLERIAPHLRTPELQQAADDILERMKEPETAELVAGIAMAAGDPAHRQALSAVLARRLAVDWAAARPRPQVVKLIEASLKDPETRTQGIAMAASTLDARYLTTLEGFARDAKIPEETRVDAVDALAQLQAAPSPVLDQLLEAVRGKLSSTPVAEAAARAVARRPEARKHLTELLGARDYPLGVRREALRALSHLWGGGNAIIKLARDGKLPDDLKTEATTVLYASSDRQIREEAAKVLPLPKIAGGHPLPSIGELMRRPGDANHGREVFFRAGSNSCGGCHRVQGQGNWVGPDLSTIGVKYGRDELIRSILNPSAAIGYSFRSMVLALSDGRVLTGLPVEESSDRIVLKTADGQRVTVPTASIEERRTSDVSLMPEGLAQSMTDRDLVDLLVYLTTLKQPVSIVGQYHVVGPLSDSGESTRINPASPVDLEASLDDGRGRKLSWRRMNANAEGRVDLSALVSADPKNGASFYAYTPIVSATAQKAKLVLDTPAEVAVWLDGKPVSLSGARDKGEPRTAAVDLAQGAGSLLIRVTPDRTSRSPAAVVTTFVAGQPVGFASSH
ncbi:MAG: PVC-type heme-binding CxxCH protein [Isosphaeraceae bacterium]